MATDACLCGTQKNSQENEEKASEYRGSEIDQVVPAAQSSPINCEKRENLLPFVGLNNLGNTCYLNSILQVLYFCPGFKSGVKHLFNIISRKKEALKDETNQKDKVKNETTTYIRSIVMEIHLLRNEKVIDTQRIWEEDNRLFLC